MRIRANTLHRARRNLILGAVTILAAQLAFVAPTRAEHRDWQAEVAAIPTTRYARDAKLSISEPGAALRPLLDDLGQRRFDPVLADLDNRYFDGARLNTPQDGAAAYDNLAHLASYLKSRAGNGDPFVDALVGSMTSVRMLADAAVQDATATIGPFRTIVPPPSPAPPGLTEAFADLDSALRWRAKSDDQLVKANPEPATRHASKAYDDARNVLTRLGITYTGDHDNDGVVDVVELRFGSSPLLVDSDGDGLTDKFEIEQLAGWTLPGMADTDGDGVSDAAEDVDVDGLTNLREQELGTSPTNADTDGDGVSDGVEVDRGTNPLVADAPRPLIGGGAPDIVAAPNDTDTDGDGLSDLAEAEEGTDPANVDTDRDGLSDGAEVKQWDINPLNPDSDGDSLRDDYESVHVEDQGLDPGRPDEQVSTWTYVTDFVAGFILGDFDPIDSMAWLAGNLCSGALSFIPVFGWIAGLITDLRDAIANAINGDWVGAGFSALGAVPYVGDAIALPRKAAAFVLKYSHRLTESVRLVTRYDKIPDTVKELALELILGETWTYLVGEDAVGTAGIGSFRYSKKALITIARGDRVDLEKLKKAIELPNHLPVDRKVPFIDGPDAGEDFLHDVLLAGTPGDLNRQLWVPTTGFSLPTGRYADGAVTDPSGSIKLHEVKTGVSNRPSNIDQCLKDDWIKSAAGRAAHGQNITAVHWHFLPNQRNMSLGVSDRLLECLVAKNIPFTIYIPDL